MPTQIGSTRCPSSSRRMMIGMLVTGSTISPLIVISICMGSSERCWLCVTRVHTVGSVGPRCQAEVAEWLAPDAVRARASDRSPASMRPIHSRGPGRFTTVLPVVRPDSSESRRRLAASISTSNVWPTSASKHAQLDLAAAVPAAPRSAASSPPPARRPRYRFAASVFGRSEYLNEKMLWYPTRDSATASRRSPSAVSPGKPDDHVGGQRDRREPPRARDRRASRYDSRE